MANAHLEENLDCLPETFGQAIFIGRPEISSSRGMYFKDLDS